MTTDQVIAAKEATDRLIAAAPELLEVAALLVGFSFYSDVPLGKIQEKARAAIAKVAEHSARAKANMTNDQMTNDQRLQTELTHMIGLCEPPYTLNWRPYCRAKASALAETEPDVFASLPRMLDQKLTDLSRNSSTAASTAEQEQRSE